MAPAYRCGHDASPKKLQIIVFSRAFLSFGISFSAGARSGRRARRSKISGRTKVPLETRRKLENEWTRGAQSKSCDVSEIGFSRNYADGLPSANSINTVLTTDSPFHSRPERTSSFCGGLDNCSIATSGWLVLAEYRERGRDGAKKQEGIGKAGQQERTAEN